MKARTIAVLVVIAVVIVAIVVVVTQRGKDSGPEVVKIGVILPLTGEAAYVGTSVKSGMDLALDEANERFASKRLKLDLLYEDSADQVKNAVSAYSKLTSVNKVRLVACVSAGWKALIPMADKENRVLFCTAVSPSKVAARSRWAFRFFISADSDASLMADFVAKHLKLSKVAIVYVNDEFGNSYCEVFTKAFEGHGGKIVAAEGFVPAETDFKPILTRIKATGPEAVYLLAYGNNMALVPKQMRALGLTVPILTIGTISQPDIMKQAGESVEGAYYTTTQFNTFAPATPELKQFVDDYIKRYQRPPIFFEVFGYDTINMLATVIADSGPSPKAVRDGLLGLKGYKAAAGEVLISSEGEAVFPVMIRQIKDGKLVNVEW